MSSNDIKSVFGLDRDFWSFTEHPVPLKHVVTSTFSLENPSRELLFKTSMTSANRPWDSLSLAMLALAENNAKRT